MTVSLDYPLVIDLDGTLINTDSLDETFLNTLRSNPLSLLRLPKQIIVGRSAVKEFLAQQAPLESNTWPVNQDFISYIEEQVELGRKVVLATAADRVVAEAIAERYPFISEIFSSNGSNNLKGRAKAECLRERFPEGFIYAGDSKADLTVWEESSAAILVNANQSVTRKANEIGSPLAEFIKPKFSFSIFRRSVRLHQWAKNLLIFVPLVLGGKAGDPSAWITAILGFVALGFVASASYIINDLWDLPSDRQHWSKKTRPLASGDLSIRSGIIMTIMGLMIGFGIAAYIGLAAFAMLGLYMVVTLSYSFFWKRIPILDVFVIAGLFTIRLAFGIVLSSVLLSPWLLVFSMFVFLSLSLAKRHTEVLRLVQYEVEDMSGRGYRKSDTPITLSIGLASMMGSVLIMILYLIEDAFPRNLYSNPEFLWVVPSVLFLFLGRVWLLSQRGELHDDPVAFALKDRVSLFLGGIMGCSVVAAIAGTNML